ncbi:MAG TPA: NADP-dependent oxidoreductase [Ramlibacter sp.]|nr:NADP-dependent oxidoreductase [Ramlibacter sp.]
MQMPDTNRQWIYQARPEAQLETGHFRWQTAAVPQPAPGEVQVRVQLLSVDPSQRTWMAGPSYRPMLQPGEVMASYAIGQVLESRSPDFAPGDRVEGDLGWQDVCAVTASALRKRDRDRSPEDIAGVLGITGATAYIGLLEIGQPRPGDQVLVSGAAGAVGTIAVQVARKAGCRVVAVAGGAAKCQRLRELGVDDVVDYKAGALRAELKRALPRGVDVFFDNVGGSVLETALPSMNIGGRIVCCGAISAYDAGQAPPGPRGVPALLVARRLRMQGFVVLDYPMRREAAEAQLARWIDDGSLTAPTHLTQGLENAPAALIELLAGGNFGKAMVRVA